MHDLGEAVTSAAVAGQQGQGEGRRRRTFPALAVFALLACALAGVPAGAGETVVELPPYRIGVEDVLDVNVWKNTEVSRQVWVRPDGRITLPLVGEVFVQGFTTKELAEILTDRLKDFFTDPLVTITLVEINSYNVYLLGRIGSPGVLKLRSPRTFLQVLAMAGGFQEFADTGSVVLVRRENGVEKRIEVDARKIVAKGTERDFLLLPGDVIIVP